MVKVTNDFGDRYSGAVGQSGVFATTRGVMYRRAWRRPTNPRTPAQRRVRGSFRDAVSRWHGFNPMQQQAYTPLASGRPFSGYNLFISRWQRMTPAQRAAFVPPHFGFKQIGVGPWSAEQTLSTVANQQEYTLGTLPVVINSVAFTQGAGNLNPGAVLVNRTGRVHFLRAVTGVVTIDYTAGGEVVTGHALGTNIAAGTVITLPHMNIVFSTATLRVGGTPYHLFEVDVIGRRLAVRGAPTYTVGGTIRFRNYTAIPEARLEWFRVNTTTLHFRGFSDSSGILPVSVTHEDGNKDGVLAHPAHQRIIRANIPPTDAAMDEYIGMVV